MSGSLDTCGPYGCTDGVGRYLLIFMDDFSGLISGHVAEDLKTESMVHGVRVIFHNQMVPKMLNIDRHKTWFSEAFRDFTDRIEMELSFSLTRKAEG